MLAALPPPRWPLLTPTLATLSCPSAPAHQTKAIVSTPLLPLLFAVAYAVLAWQAWHSGSLQLVEAVLRAAKPWPDASLLATMFQDRTVAALAWLHLLMLDFLTARCVSSPCVDDACTQSFTAPPHTHTHAQARHALMTRAPVHARHAACRPTWRVAAGLCCWTGCA